MMSFLKRYVTNISAFIFLSVCVSQSIFAQEINISTFNYAVKGNDTLYMDIYKDVNSSENEPLFVFMHGGGFSSGSPKHPDIIKMGIAAAKKGFTAAMISYRLTRKGASFGCGFEADGKIETFKLASEDLFDALSYLQNNEETLSIDFSKIYVGGSSAGAEAVLNAVFNKNILFKENEFQPNFKYSGVFSLAGALLDTSSVSENNKIPTVFFHGTADNLVPFNSAPHHFCDQDLPGYLILHGSNSIAKKLHELDSSYLMYAYNNKGHEISRIPLDKLDEVFDFFLNNQESTTAIKKIIEL